MFIGLTSMWTDDADDGDDDDDDDWKQLRRWSALVMVIMKAWW